MIIGYMCTGSNYLQVNNSGEITVTSDENMASMIKRDGNNILCGDKYLRLDNGKFVFGSQNSAASAVNTGQVTMSYGALTF